MYGAGGGFVKENTVSHKGMHRIRTLGMGNDENVKRLSIREVNVEAEMRKTEGDRDDQSTSHAWEVMMTPDTVRLLCKNFNERIPLQILPALLP